MIRDVGLFAAGVLSCFVGLLLAGHVFLKSEDRRWARYEREQREHRAVVRRMYGTRPWGPN